MAVYGLSTVSFTASSLPLKNQIVEAKVNYGRHVAVSLCCRSQISEEESGERGRRRIWRRRKLVKKDEFLPFKMERVPFLEEQVRKIREGGKILSMDIERLLLSEDNRFDFVNGVAAEAKQYVENNRDEYGGAKKAIFHVLSNRMNDAGFYRPEAYVESDPFKPGPGYLREDI
ncbi:protein PLASTID TRANSCRIPTIONALLY ACTIVE 7 isoform X2 [Impatiens glandulifera]|uniref:protein PLASTID TRANSCRIPTIONALLY ACTIVE 7 isoform X2 n=1 Tax=Impatiens glandulifera TaxID=253017 RepID=UPI001FB104AD|nr:protein PLASTID TRANSCRIPTIONALLY ACTIVE 7 isoform X2 [Impatiens glandulifera]